MCVHFMLGNEHVFSSARSIIWGFVFVSSGIGLGLKSVVSVFLSVHHCNFCEPDLGGVDFSSAPAPSPDVRLSSLHTYSCPSPGSGLLFYSVPSHSAVFQGYPSVSVLHVLGALTLQILSLLILRGAESQQVCSSVTCNAIPQES